MKIVKGMIVVAGAVCMCAGLVQAAQTGYMYVKRLPGFAPSGYRDTDGPVAVGLSPGSGDVDVSVATSLRITFNEDVVAGSGEIVVSGPKGVFDTIVVPSAQVAVSGTRATIFLSSDLSFETGYTVSVPEGAFLDVYGNGSAAISGWSFTTVAESVGEPPVWTSPKEGEVAVGVVGESLAAVQFDASGVAPLEYVIVDGALPGGMALSASGELSGTPGVSGTFDFTVRVTDATGQSADRAFFVTVERAAALEISPTIVSLEILDGASESEPVTLTVSNTGEAASGEISAMLSDDVHFAILDNSCTSLIGGDSCTIDVVLAAEEDGDVDGSLTVSATPGGAAIATLSGHAEGFSGGSGNLVCWGYNNAGQLGNGETANSWSPVAVVGLPGAPSMVAGGDSHSCAIVSGALYCWGANDSGQLGNGSTTASLTPVAVSSMGSGVTFVVAGGANTCAVRDNQVYCWGANTYGQVGNGTTSTSVNAPVASTGMSGTIADLTVYNNHVCTVKNQAAWCWGYNNKGQLGNGGTINQKSPVAVSNMGSSVEAISGGNTHTCAIQGGKVWCWGDGAYGQLGAPSSSYVPVAVTNLESGVTALDAGAMSNCAIQGGKAWCWGYNSSGQLGNNSTTTARTPVAVSILGTSVSHVSAGSTSVCALDAGTLFCWGANNVGQLGNGTNTASLVPVSLVGIVDGAGLVVAGMSHACAIVP